MELLEQEWHRRYGATLWPVMPRLFSGTTVLRSATQEEVDSYYKAEADAARLPRNGKRLVPPRPLLRVCFIRPDGHGGIWLTEVEWSPEAQAKYDEEHQRNEQATRRTQ